MKRLFSIVAGASLVTPTLTAALVVDGNFAAVVGAAISTVALTMVVVGWIDKRIDHKIKNYAATVKVHHYVTLREISNLRELLGHPALNIPEIIEDEKASG